MPDVVLMDGRRTPFQRAGTGFADLMSYQLGAAAITGVLEASRVEADAVDRVVLGATVHNPRTTNVAREAALVAGIPASVPALTITAAGASATAAIAYGVDLIRTGQAEIVVAGGSDCVSDPPIGYSRAMRKKLLAGRRRRGLWSNLRFLASLRPWDFLPDIPDVSEFSTGQTMGEYTEGLARRLGLGRDAQDTYAARSHHRAAAARGHLKAEITPVDIPEVDTPQVDVPRASARITDDNGIRDQTSPELLARLSPSFAPSGTLTAGNSSFLTDGAAVVLLMSAERAEREARVPKATILANAMTAHDPREELLLGPVYAIREVLESTGVSFRDIDVFEIHEAFAAQILAVIRLLEDEPGLGRIADEKLNAWGGSLAIGNPFAPNGARLVTTAANRLRHEGRRHAIVATCAGGGLGQAFILEAPR